MSSKLAREALDSLIEKARVDFYKPIQVAEVLHQHRMGSGVSPLKLDSYRNPSIKWRNSVTQRLLGKVSTSSARYQHDVWNDHAMPPPLLDYLASINVETSGAVEKYIYSQFQQRNASVVAVFDYVNASTTEDFVLSDLLGMMIADPGTRRSVDKVYEIVTYSLFETIINGLGTTITVSLDTSKELMYKEFQTLASVLLGITDPSETTEFSGHLYRVGVTNAADRGLDMWANFGPAVQVKHLTLNQDEIGHIVQQVESDRVVVVCRSTEAGMISALLSQLSWGARVAGIVTESELETAYDKALRGTFADELGEPLLERVRNGIAEEFHYASELAGFLSERGYDSMQVTASWE